MATIYAKTQDQVLLATILPKLACNSKNVVKLHVDFDATWDGYTAKSAIFYTDYDHTPYTELLSNGECTVPAEVLTNEGYLFITIQGVKTASGAIKPTTPIKYKVLPGTPSLIISDPSGNVYQRLLAECARIDNIIAHNNNTDGNTELTDLRTGADGITYTSAGAAIRTQIGALNNLTNESNPFNLFCFNKRAYYKGSASFTSNDDIVPSSALVNLAEYQDLNDAGESNLYAVAGKLTEAIPVFSGESDYSLIVDSDISDKLTVRFSSTTNWASDATHTSTSALTIKKGLNVLPLNFENYNNAGHSVFNYLCIQSTNIKTATRYDVYIVKNSALTNYIADRIDDIKNNLIYKNLDIEPSVHHSNIECTATYNNSLLVINLPEKTTEVAEWRYAIVSFNLGRDLAEKKLLVRRNTGNIKSFGIGASPGEWAAKNFSTDYDIHEIDLAEFIADNTRLANNTGDYYLIIGVEVANTSTYNHEYNESVNVMEITGAANSLSPLARLAEFNPDDYERKTGKYITCWGDSLTAGAGWTERLAALSGVPVYNAGTGGENARTITARQGADVIMVNNITIPAAVEAVTVATYAKPFTTAFGYNATPLLQGGSSHINPVKIGGIEGTLKWTGSNYNDTNGTWIFTRSKAGEAVTINRPTALVTAYDREKNNPHLMVIFMGQNDGNFDIDELVNLHRLMINHAKAKHTIILGLSSGSAESRTEYEAAMKKAFGRYFISLREYLSQYGLADAGLTPTAADEADMATGTVPPQLLADAVHYTNATKTVIGNLIYKRACELGIFEA